jgi:hypothetical protein
MQVLTGYDYRPTIRINPFLTQLTPPSPLLSSPSTLHSPLLCTYDFTIAIAQCTALLSATETFPKRKNSVNWSGISLDCSFSRPRSAKQCRERYQNHLDPKVSTSSCYMHARHAYARCIFSHATCSCSCFILKSPCLRRQPL